MHSMTSVIILRDVLTGFFNHNKPVRKNHQYSLQSRFHRQALQSLWLKSCPNQQRKNHITLRIIGPSKLAILRTLTLHHTGSFTLPLEGTRSLGQYSLISMSFDAFGHCANMGYSNSLLGYRNLGESLTCRTYECQIYAQVAVFFRGVEASSFLGCRFLLKKNMEKQFKDSIYTLGVSPTH